MTKNGQWVSIPGARRVRAITLMKSPKDIVMQLLPLYSGGCLYWRIGNDVRHIKKVNLRRDQSVLGLVTTTGKSTIPVYLFSCHSSALCRCNEYWRSFPPPLWKKRRVLCSSRPCEPGRLAYAYWQKSLTGVCHHGFRYAYMTGSIHRRLKSHKWHELVPGCIRTLLSMRASSITLELTGNEYA